jgi:hypothetical protein
VSPPTPFPDLGFPPSPQRSTAGDGNQCPVRSRNSSLQLWAVQSQLTAHWHMGRVRGPHCPRHFWATLERGKFHISMAARHFFISDGPGLDLVALRHTRTQAGLSHPGAAGRGSRRLEPLSLLLEAVPAPSALLSGHQTQPSSPELTAGPPTPQAVFFLHRVGLQPLPQITLLQEAKVSGADSGKVGPVPHPQPPRSSVRRVSIWSPKALPPTDKGCPSVTKKALPARAGSCEASPQGRK